MNSTANNYQKHGKTIDFIPTVKLFYDELCFLPFLIKNYAQLAGNSLPTIWTEENIMKLDDKVEIRGTTNGPNKNKIQYRQNMATFLANPINNYALVTIDNNDIPLNRAFRTTTPNFMGYCAPRAPYTIAFIQLDAQSTHSVFEGKVFNTTTYHNDGYNSASYMFQVSGRKRFFFLQNGDNSFDAVYGVPYFQDEKRRKKAFEEYGAVYFDLEEGDLLCFPNNFYHEVYNLSRKNIAVSGEVFNPFFFRPRNEDFEPADVYFKYYENATHSLYTLENNTVKAYSKETVERKALRDIIKVNIAKIKEFVRNLNLGNYTREVKESILKIQENLNNYTKRNTPQYKNAKYYREKKIKKKEIKSKKIRENPINVAKRPGPVQKKGKKGSKKIKKN
jgi:hypothetical protein